MTCTERALETALSRVGRRLKSVRTRAIKVVLNTRHVVALHRICRSAPAIAARTYRILVVLREQRQRKLHIVYCYLRYNCRTHRVVRAVCRTNLGASNKRKHVHKRLHAQCMLLGNAQSYRVEVAAFGRLAQFEDKVQVGVACT